MQNKKYFIIALFLGLSLLFLVNCKDKSSQPPHSRSTTPQKKEGPTLKGGGVDGGGGNYVGTPKAQVEVIFNGDRGFNLKETVKDVFKMMEEIVQGKNISDEVISIFSVMLGKEFNGDPYDIYQDIEATTYQLKEKGPCLENKINGHTDASTKIGVKGSPICFSLERLMELPVQAIPFQLVALAVHEHAHHYQFNESDAVKAQKYILKAMNQVMINGIWIETLTLASDFRNATSYLLKEIHDSEYSDKLICKHLAALNAKAFQLVKKSHEIEKRFEVRLLVTALDNQFSLSKESLEGVKDLALNAMRILYYCGKDPLYKYPGGDVVEEGDKEKLKQKLEEQFRLSSDITQQIIDISDKRKEQ